MKTKNLMMKNSIFFIVSLFVIFSCGENNKTEKKSSETAKVFTKTTKKVKAFPKLEEGEIFLKNKNPFGEIIELKGKNITGDTAIFKVSETEMLIKDSLLISKNLIFYPFRVFGTKDLKEIKEFGVIGQGPDEFREPTLVPTNNKDLLCYIFENSNEKLYALDRNMNLIYVKEPFQTQNKGRRYAKKQMVNIGKSDFIYASDSKTGKSIYRINKQGDSIVTKEVFNLALNPKRKSPFNYIGAFAVNSSKNRMVYAYKYFKILKFMDLDGKKVRTINFEKETFKQGSIYKVNGLDSNVTHYWKIASGEDYVYLLYSGRTPYEVGKESSKGINYIYIEQYDWNGNPIKKYKLDQWGYFTVDEKNKKFYLASYYFDDPFIEYQIP